MMQLLAREKDFKAARLENFQVNSFRYAIGTGASKSVLSPKRKVFIE